MPKQFKEQYPTTRVIIDATEIQPHLPELQQMTFSNYKVLVGISPDGAITFVSSLFPGCNLIRHLLDSGDSVMADRGFDIEEDLMLRGVRLNIPPFLRATFRERASSYSTHSVSANSCGTCHGENQEFSHI